MKDLEQAVVERFRAVGVLAAHDSDVLEWQSPKFSYVAAQRDGEQFLRFGHWRSFQVEKHFVLDDLGTKG